LTRVLPLPGDTDRTLVERTFGPFHEHFELNTSWYHLPLDTSGMLTGQYKALIEHIPLEEIIDEGSPILVEGEPRPLFDYNRKLFNPTTGTFFNANFLEFIPSDPIAGSGLSGDQVSFLVNILPPITTDIEITMTATASPVTIPGPITFVVTATNIGPNAATGVEVTDIFSGASFIPTSIIATGSTIFMSNTWSIGSLSPGASETLTLAGPASVAGTVTNTATVTALNQLDSDASNDSATEDVTVEVAP